MPLAKPWLTPCSVLSQFMISVCFSNPVGSIIANHSGMVWPVFSWRFENGSLMGIIVALRWGVGNGALPAPTLAP